VKARKTLAQAQSHPQLSKQGQPQEPVFENLQEGSQQVIMTNPASLHCSVVNANVNASTNVNDHALLPRGMNLVNKSMMMTEHASLHHHVASMTDCTFSCCRVEFVGMADILGSVIEQSDDLHHAVLARVNDYVNDHGVILLRHTTLGPFRSQKWGPRTYQRGGYKN
jgi:hypothetical protein